MATETKKKTTAPERKKRQAIPGLDTETNEQRFIRLGEQRTKQAIRRIMMLGTLAGPNYKSTDEQRKRIVDLLRQAVNAVEVKLEKKTAATIEVKL